MALVQNEILGILENNFDLMLSLSGWSLYMETNFIMVLMILIIVVADIAIVVEVVVSSSESEYLFWKQLWWTTAC